MRRESLDALIVCGNQYAGFEGAVFYVSGFEIVHRYVYVLIPLEGEPTLVFPREARWIGDKAKPWVKDQVWPDVPGHWLAERASERKWKRVAVYGMNFVMAVRDYRELAKASFELVPFDTTFDMVRAVKSEEELVEVRDAMDIILDGFWALVAAYEPGKTEAEIMAPAVERFFARGAGPRMMNILLSGTHGEAEAAFKVPGNRVVAENDLLLYSLEVTGTGCYWVEFSRRSFAEKSARERKRWRTPILKRWKRRASSCVPVNSPAMSTRESLKNLRNMALRLGTSRATALAPPCSNIRPSERRATSFSRKT